MALQSTRNSETSRGGAVPTGYAEEIVLSDATFRETQRKEGFTPLESTQKTSKKRKREDKGDSGEVYGANSYRGPWAKFEVRETP